MTQFKTLKVRLSSSQLNKLKSRMKSGTEITLNLSSNWIGNSNDDISSPHLLQLSDTPVPRICNFFSNCSSANTKFSRTQLPNMIQSGWVLHQRPIFGNILSSVAKKGTDIARCLGNDFLE